MKQIPFAVLPEDGKDTMEVPLATIVCTELSGTEHSGDQTFTTMDPKQQATYLGSRP